MPLRIFAFCTNFSFQVDYLRNLSMEIYQKPKWTFIILLGKMNNNRYSKQ